MLASLHRGLAITLVSARGLPAGLVDELRSHSFLGAGVSAPGGIPTSWGFIVDLGTEMIALRAGDAALCGRGQAASGAGRTPSWPSSPAMPMMMRLSMKMPSRKRSMVQASIVAVRPVAGMAMNSPL